MSPYPLPADYIRTGFALWALAFEAQTVIAYRSLGLWGVTTPAPDENSRMIEEKTPAFVAAALDASRAAWGGKRPDQIANAWIAPLTRKARANRRRLMRPR